MNGTQMVFELQVWSWQDKLDEKLYGSYAVAVMKRCVLAAWEYENVFVYMNWCGARKFMCKIQPSYVA